MVRLTDHPDMTLDVYRGRKTTKQQQQQIKKKTIIFTFSHKKAYVTKFDLGIKWAKVNPGLQSEQPW